MKPGLLSLIAAAGIAAVAALVAYGLMRPASSADWLCHEFGLEGEAAREARAMHADFQVVCDALCERIERADRRLADLAATGRALTPELRDAIADTEAVRAECRVRMLEYFYRTSALMAEPERQRYLEMVLPVASHPERMARQ